MILVNHAPRRAATGCGMSEQYGAGTREAPFLFDHEPAECFLRRVEAVAHMDLVNSTAHRMEAETRGARFVAFDGAERQALHVHLHAAHADHTEMRIGEKIINLEMETGEIALSGRTDEIEPVVAAELQQEFILRKHRLSTRPGRDFHEDVLGRARHEGSRLLSRTGAGEEEPACDCRGRSPSIHLLSPVYRLSRRPSATIGRLPASGQPGLYLLAPVAAQWLWCRASPPREGVDHDRQLLL